MRLRFVIFYSVLIIAAISSAFALYVKSELEYLKIYTPTVDNITSQPKAVYTEIYGANDLLMYKHQYVKSAILPTNCDMEILAPLVDMMIETKSNLKDGKGVERWKLYIMDMHNIDPFSLKGVVLGYYAENLLESTDLSGLRAEVVRWYTLDKLKKVYPQHELYEMLLNSTEFTENVYGISAAANHFFFKDINDCNYLELAFLVAILSGKDKPLDPLQEFANLDSMARQYVYRLFKTKIISTDEYQALRSRRIALNYEKYRTIEPSYVNAVLKQVRADKRFSENENVLIIKTGYNPDVTRVARDAISEYLSDKSDRLQLSFVLLNTRTNSVEAVIGSRVETSTRNRAINTKRQMASTFKPFVYLTAFANGVLPTDIIVDQPYTFRSGAYQYRPKNYENAFFGKTIVRQGLIHSLNNATIKLAEKIGLKKVRDMARQVGMQGNILPIHAMALGSYPATPLNVAQMYSTIANMGVKHTPSLILSVKADGEEINMIAEPKRVAPATAAYQVMYIMQDVARNGTAKSAGLLDGTAIKTGTSNNFVDAWAASIFGDYVAVAWVGYDNFISMGEKGAGGFMAAPFIALFQKKYFGENVSFDTTPPDNIVYKRVSKYTGKLWNRAVDGTYIEAFNANRIPKQ